MDLSTTSTNAGALAFSSAPRRGPQEGPLALPKMESPFSAVFSAAKLAELIQRTGQVKPDAVNQNNTQRKRHFPEIDINKIIKERMEEQLPVRQDITSTI